MTPMELALALVRARRKAGLTQQQVAERMSTTQSSIARAEAGKSVTTDFVERYARAVGRPIQLRFGSASPRLSSDEVDRRVRRATRSYTFDPWSRSPTRIERMSLERDRQLERADP